MGNTDGGEKRCTRCKDVKSVSEFYKNRCTSDGLSYQCKPCQKAVNDKYWNENRPRLNSELRYRRRDGVKRQRLDGDEWIAAKRERQRTRNAKWREENKELARAAGRRHAARRRARVASVPTVEFTESQLLERWSYYGDKCWICGQPATETDHVKPLSKGGGHMLCNLRPICRSCNASKCDEWPYRTEVAA